MPEAMMMRGDEALAYGAATAGVGLVAGYPGSPATSVFNHLLARAGEIQAHWAPNERVAMEMAFGASLTGMRSLVVLKSVGMNVALDPLATMALSGCHAGLVIALGDDPGGWGSQNEQDSRWAARVAEVPVIEPLDVAQAPALMTQAYAWSESLGLPVIVRFTRAFALGCEAVSGAWELPPSTKRFLRAQDRWVVLPPVVEKRHRTLHRRLRKLSRLLDASPYDRASGQGSVGVLAVGYTYTKLEQLLASQQTRPRLLGLSSVWPLPERSLARWLEPLTRVLILEEGGPFVEQSVRSLVQRCGFPIQVLGRDRMCVVRDGAVPEEDELDGRQIGRALATLDPAYGGSEGAPCPRHMPAETPLCEDCPYRPVFEALLQAMARHGGRERYIVVGEPGCMVRANLPPMNLFDVKYSLGSGPGLSLGLALGAGSHHVVGILGDSSFLHSGITALPHVARCDPPLTLLVLDNGTTALTGGQPHAGSTVDEKGNRRCPVDLAEAILALGAKPEVCSATDAATLGRCLGEALVAESLRVIIARGPCPRHEAAC